MDDRELENKRLGHFDDGSYGADEDVLGFREKVREALKPVKHLIDDCEEIWSPTGDGAAYLRGMAIVVQEVNKVSSNAAGRILVYTGWQRFKAVENDDYVEFNATEDEEPQERLLGKDGLFYYTGRQREDAK